MIVVVPLVVLLDVTGVDVVSTLVLAVEDEVGIVAVKLVVVYLIEPVVEYVVLRLLVLLSVTLVVNEGVPAVVVSSVCDIIMLFDVPELLDGAVVTELEVE